MEFGPCPIAVVAVADQHLGSPGVDTKLVFEHADLIARTPGLYAINLGDTIDNMIVGRLQTTGVFDCESIEWQRSQLERYLRYLSNSLIAYVSGNHELFTYSLTRLDPSEDLSSGLGIIYDKYELYLVLKVGHQTYRLHARHKYRGNSEYNDLHAAIKLYHNGNRTPFNDHNPDIVVLGHTHTYSWGKMFKQGKLRIFAITGSYKTSDGWAKSKGYNPAAPLFPIFIFHPDRHCIEIHDDLEYVANEYLPWLRSKTQPRV